ncbi:carboxypeptidase-like regulatory domain-containing protein [Edaphobacter bradus]|uniref:carboxypeptidase-like regulatory domain-containing protein n=1 Tax=Edaphobacter bradus TaxID=2259016 RepID=UPI0021E0A4B8|nr:carboxypeptidase-like regulatory domain-containing protein [Edaphobacter bradus]
MPLKPQNCWLKGALVLALSLICGPVAQAGAQELLQSSAAGSELPETPTPRMLATIAGTVTDHDGAIVPGAKVTLGREGQPPGRTVATDADGRFCFANVTPGPFTLSISATGFASQQTSGQVQAGQSYEVSAISLTAATAIEVQAVTQRELAEEQVRIEERQRVLGFIPNFYVSYEPNPMPLAPAQKFELAWKASFDPINLGITGAVAGVQQANDDFDDYGQGSQGYAKRYAASYATSFAGTLLGNAVLPILFKQDPRYFYKGTGSTRSRVLYAIANAVICKGDNGRWQPNYSSILGNLAAGGISNLYYPAANREGARLTFEDAGIGIAGSAVANVFQEFVVRRLTPHVHNSAMLNP